VTWFVFCRSGVAKVVIRGDRLTHAGRHFCDFGSAISNEVCFRSEEKQTTSVLVASNPARNEFGE
jgi:hypothetical protein